MSKRLFELQEKYTNLEIVFDNCETIIIPKERVLKLDFGEFKEINMLPTNTDNKYWVCEHLFLDIKFCNKLDLEYNPLDYDEPVGMYKDSELSNKVVDRPNILGRILLFKDIAGIRLIKDEDDNDNTISQDYIYPPSSNVEPYLPNEFMKSEIKDNVLSISIKGDYLTQFN